MRVVFDTNVLLSAVLWQRHLKAIYDAIRSSNITPCFTQDTFAELQRTLSYEKFKQQLLTIGVTADEIVDLLSSRSYFAPEKLKVAVTRISNNPGDNAILACAISAQAACIVSGDRHLVQLEQFLTPRQFLAHRSRAY